MRDLYGYPLRSSAWWCVRPLLTQLDAHSSSRLPLTRGSSFVAVQNVATKRNETSNKLDVKYDYYTRHLQDDDSYSVSNPIDPVTGLWKTDDQLELLQTLLQHGYDSALHASMSSHPLLLVERSYNPPPLRQQMLQVLFEEHNVPSVFFGRDAALACFGCGRVTGTVVDLGYGGTTVTPVYDGYVESKGIRRSPVGLAATDEWILQQLDQLYQKTKGVSAGEIQPLYQVRNAAAGRRHPDIHRAARLHMAGECREMGVGAAINTALLGSAAVAVAPSAGAGGGGGAAAAVAPGSFHAPHKSYELPDGTILDVPSAQRFAAADFLLGGGAAASSSPGSAAQEGSAAAQQQQRRDDALQFSRKAVTELIRGWKESKEEEDDDDDENDTAPAKKDDGEFSEAASVGISKRRTYRDAHATTATSTKSGAPTQPLYSNPVLQRACLPHYQTYLDQYLTSASVPTMICDAAYRCDRDQQVALLGNVVLGGGGACLGPTDQAVPDWVREHLEVLIHAHTPGWRVKVLSPGLPERSVLSWLGGSILGSMGTFHEMWITKKEYEEWGTAIVNRKCP